jgi:3-oxoisoapionate kinase
MRAPLLGWYGDDFTGATDTLAVLAQAGLRAMLFLGVPGHGPQAAADKALGGALQAVGIAGASRSMSPTETRVELEPVGEFFAAIGTAVLHYKVCSTFDSAPGIGNIGAAVDVLRRYVRNPFLPIVGGQPNLGRYCAFSNLFAAAGAGGSVERIDRHPTMRNHPVTPMSEADLRRHLALQGLAPMAAVHYPVYSRPFAAQQGLLQALLDDRPSAVLLDVALPEHLAAIGRLMWQRAQLSPLLAVGPSGVAQALIAHWSESGELQHSAEPARPIAPANAPVFVFAGSLSPVTAAQVRAARSFEPMAVDAGALLGSPASANEACNKICRSLAEGRHVLACTAPADRTRAETGQSATLARATAAMVDAVVHQRAAQGTPLSRVGIAGGDTSSLAVKALGGWGLSYRGALGAGVTVSTLHSDDPSLDGLELMLKGGQMGNEDVFERLIGPSV